MGKCVCIYIFLQMLFGTAQSNTKVLCDASLKQPMVKCLTSSKATMNVIEK